MDWLRWILLLIGAAIVAVIWWNGYRRARERDETLFERARRDPGADSVTEPAPSDDPAAIADPDSDLPPDLDISSFEPLPADPAAPDVEVGGEVTRRAERPVPEQDAPESPAEAVQAEADFTEPPPEAPPHRIRPDGDESAAAGKGEPDTAERIESVFLVAAGGQRLVGSRLQELFTSHGLRHGEMGIFHLFDPEGHVQFSVANLVEPGTFDPATMDTLSTPGIALFVRLPGPPSAEIAFDRMIRTARSMADQLEARLLDQHQSTLTHQTEQHLRDQMRDWDHRHPRSRA